MDLDYQFDSIKEIFSQVGCQVERAGNVVTVTKGESGSVLYELPRLLAANQRRVPAWFLARIWEDTGLPLLTNFNYSYYFSGWNFTMPDGSQTWIKDLPHDESKRLIYWRDNFYISDLEENLRSESRKPAKDDFVANFPKGSLYHVIELFEEKGWFDNETAIPSQSIDGYRK